MHDRDEILAELDQKTNDLITLRQALADMTHSRNEVRALADRIRRRAAADAYGEGWNDGYLKGYAAATGGDEPHGGVPEAPPREQLRQAWASSGHWQEVAEARRRGIEQLRTLLATRGEDWCHVERQRDDARAEAEKWRDLWQHDTEYEDEHDTTLPWEVDRG